MPDETNPSPSDVVMAQPPQQPPFTATTATVEAASPIPKFGLPSVGVSIQPSPTVPDALVAKMTPEHLTSVIAQAGAESASRSKERMLAMSLGAGVIAFTLLIVLAICIAFLVYNKAEFAMPIATLILGLLSGGAGGFGLGRITAPGEKQGSSPL